MGPEHLVLCGGARLTSRQDTWREVKGLCLRLGDGRGDVHLRLEHLSRPLCANLPEVAVDLLELAAYVYAADQAVSRGGTRAFEYGARWRRHFRFEVPVRRPDIWGRPEVADALAETLGFLADEDYEFGFSRLTNPPRLDRYLFDSYGAAGAGEYEEVVLFSGGLDSLGGAVREVLQGHRKVALVSHRPVSKVYARQCDLVRRLNRRLPQTGLRPLHVAVEVNKGKALGQDFNQRTRSFLFAAVAAVVALLSNLSRVRFYENGVVSLNLPLSPQVLGGRASRTTHPKTLHGFARIFTLLFGRPFRVDNPFLWQTKASILKGVKEAGHGDLCAHACSCGRTIEQTVECWHCGRCSQCVDRRLTALAAGLDDGEDPPQRYASDVLTGPREGADLILIERYVGMQRRVSGLPDPRCFLVAYPEVARALRYVGEAPERAARLAHELYRLHADQVEHGLAEAVRRESDGIVRKHHPVNCLVSIVCGRTNRPPPVPGAGGGGGARAATPAQGSGLVLDRETFEARLGEKRCFLGNTLEFALLARLNRRPGIYVSVSSLREDTWRDAQIEKNTIQRTVSNLRRKLREAGLCLVIDGSQKDHYQLKLPA